MDNETIRIIGGAYRQLVDLAPDYLPKGHLQKAAQRPLIWLARAQQNAMDNASIPPSLQTVLRVCSQSIPTSAVSDVLFEEQQSAFMLGFNSKGNALCCEPHGLEAVRRNRGLTQIELAKSAGMSSVGISYIENGKRKPTGNTLIKLAKALKCSIDDLVQSD